MQTISINKIQYQVPVSWYEVTYIQAVNVIKNIDEKDKQLNALSNIPIDIINLMPDLQVQQLFSLISFTENLEVFNDTKVKDEYKDFDFGNLEFGVAEKIRQVLNSKESGFETAIDVIKHLKDYDITNEPFLEVIGTANFFLSKSLIFTIIMPNSQKLNTAMSKSKQELQDFKILETSERMLNLQKTEY